MTHHVIYGLAVEVKVVRGGTTLDTQEGSDLKGNGVSALGSASLLVKPLERSVVEQMALVLKNSYRGVVNSRASCLNALECKARRRYEVVCN